MYNSIVSEIRKHENESSEDKLIISRLNGFNQVKEKFF